MTGRPDREDDSQPVPTSDAHAANEATSRAVLRLNARYVGLVVVLNVLVATGLVVYDLYNDFETMRIFLTDTANHAAHAVHVLRGRSDRPDNEVLDDASDLTACEMALLTREGRVYYQTHPRIDPVLRGLGWPNETTQIPSTRIMIERGLRDLSGAWSLGRYDDRLTLLIIVSRRPEDEGRFRYVSYAAAITAGGLLVSVLIMLAAANWMLRRPLVRLIDALTSALVRDVRRRREAEERAVAARLEAERHLAFLDNLLNATEELAIIATDEQGTVRLMNRSAEQILACHAGDIVGLRGLDEFLATLEPASTEGRDALFSMARPGEGERPIRDHDGGEHILQVRTSRILDTSGVYRGTLMVFSDVTERRRVEAELRSKQLQLFQSSRLATLGEMATGLAHEINQPLNNIGLLSSRLTKRLAVKTRPDEDDVAFLGNKLRAIQDQVKRAAKIIDHLRVFGRAEPAPLGTIDVRDAVRGSLELFGEQIRLHDIALALDMPDDLPLAHGDLARLEQVLINILINARFALDEHATRLAPERPGKARPKSIAVRVAEGTLPDGAPAVVVEITDNGPGMDEDVATRIFEPFFTTKEVGAGTGLGLSISYGIVREFGGVLEVETAPGEGATFRVVLEQAPTEADG